MTTAAINVCNRQVLLTFRRQHFMGSCPIFLSSFCSLLHKVFSESWRRWDGCPFRVEYPMGIFSYHFEPLWVTAFTSILWPRLKRPLTCRYSEGYSWFSTWLHLKWPKTPQVEGTHKSNFYSPGKIVVLKAYCWRNLQFLALSELGLAGSTQMFNFTALCLWILVYTEDQWRYPV